MSREYDDPVQKHKEAVKRWDAYPKLVELVNDMSQAAASFGTVGLKARAIQLLIELGELDV